MRKKALLFVVSAVSCLPLVLFWILQSNHCSKTSERRDKGTLEGLPKQLLGKDNDVNPIHQVHVTVASPQPVSSDNEYEIDPRDLQLSESLNIEERGKFQQQRVSDMCHKHFFSQEQKLPLNGELQLFFRHLMFDDKRKAIFCFVPKIGCTNMKRLMLYMGGHLPMNTVDWPWVEDSVYLEPALSKASLLNNTLTTSDKILRLKTYFKFMIVRNPLERLVSAYRNKLEPPVEYDLRDKFPNNLKIRILEDYRSAKLHQWMRVSKYNKSALSISVTFTEYVQYYVETETMKLNEHIRPSIDLCHPCLTKFDFYGNFRNYSSDVALLIDKFQTEPRFYRDKSLHSNAEQTSEKLGAYYSRLNHRDKLRLVGKMYDDLLFYYTLYPADRNSHQKLLGIKLPII